jgi:hypothetical protein
MAQEVKMARKTTGPTDAGMLATKVKPELLRVLDALPPSRQAEVLDFARFLYQQTAIPEPEKMVRQPRIKVRAVPAMTLLNLTGLVALGGDAITDTEDLYGNDGRR